MKRTLMLKNQELLDFEIDLEMGEVRILDAPDAEDPLLVSLGFGGPARDAAVTATIGSRRLSRGRDDIDEILDAFGARSSIELVFMGHGLSFTDKLWYRVPGSTERWEDINFYDNDWDGGFRVAVLTHDYERLASCSPDVPDVFDRIVENISRPALPFAVLLRHNVHENNRGEMGALRSLMEQVSASTGNDIRYAAQLVFDNEKSKGRDDKVDLVRGSCAADVLLSEGRLPTGLRPLPCGAGNLWEVAVDPQGRLYMCWEIVDKPQFAFGSARDWNPSDPVYSSSNPDKLTCYINESASQHHGECTECVWLPLCAGGCPNGRLLGNGRSCLPYKDRPEEYVLARWYAEQRQPRTSESKNRTEE